MPSSVAADEDSGGEGVDDRNDDAPEEESTEGGLCWWSVELAVLMLSAICWPAWYE